MAPANYQMSKDGIEMQFASNHIGHFLLTNLLVPEIKKGNGVVANVASGGYQIADPDFEDVNFNVRTPPNRCYERIPHHPPTPKHPKMGADEDENLYFAGRQGI